MISGGAGGPSVGRLGGGLYWGNTVNDEVWIRSFSICNSFSRSDTFCITAWFCFCASASDLPAVSIPSVTKAVSGASDNCPFPVTVNVGFSVSDSSCALAATGQANNTINSATMNMREPPINRQNGQSSRIRRREDFGKQRRAVGNETGWEDD